ncbi:MULTISPECIES: hypothetical protein [Streptomyces]|uniref:Uncharacterized protein n=1 Tax=Streptomyces chartreusis NRRL 3882 TaxID=1079985 RepID=A0A2N9BB36_STRCX|nr:MULTISPECIES: hypothetical protein [Streptomyces]MYS91452.1 hypothetical protein [Streptomyces sp. SID5464]SOR80560.1 hypothetical protein SCNRRL3882_4015 [Streptomyces chartreusis NRRL 3882]
MSTPTPPQPDFPPPLPPEPPKPAKSCTNAIIIGSAAAVIAAIVATGIVVVQSQDKESAPATTTASSAPAEDLATTAADEPEPEPTYSELDADSFTIKLRTTDRQCFGSAGCNMTVEPKLSYLGLTDDIDPDAVYEITYEIRGGDSGPVIETAELSDRTSLNYTPTVLSTASASTKVSVEITDVVVQGQ